MPRGQSSGHRTLAHFLAAHSIAIPKQAKEPFLPTPKMRKLIDCKCDKLFNKEVEDFTFTDLRKASPIKEKGVYIIRVIKKGSSPSQSLQDLEKIADIIAWEQVKKYVFSRLSRLIKIHSCALIYIGSAGTNEISKNTLKGRYNELASRHTIQFPLWLLLYLGWKLEYGWCATESPKKLENKLKDIYRKSHDGKLPALVHR